MQRNEPRYIKRILTGESSWVWKNMYVNAVMLLLLLLLLITINTSTSYGATVVLIVAVGALPLLHSHYTPTRCFLYVIHDHYTTQR
jgi:uncharacterized integral membrane protein